MRESALRLILFFFLAIMIGGVAGAEAMDENRFESVDGLIGNEQYSEAVNAFQLISKTAGNAHDRSRALLLEGSVRSFLMSDPLTALECYQKVLLLYPESPAAADALFQTAMIYYGQGRFDYAQAAFSKYIEDYPYEVRCVSAEAWLNRIGDNEKEFPIRILIAERMNRFTIQSEKTLIVQETTSSRRVCPDAPIVSAIAEKGGLTINGRMTTCRQLRIWSDADVSTFNGRRSRGIYIITVADDGLQVINQIPVEQYLYGIIPKEMPFSWSREALMAQAVASRTYALYLREQNRGLPYDVTPSILSQVYGGVDAEKPSTSVAVDVTQGQVMTFDGNLIAAYFHADSGGNTEDARYVWDVDIPYLKGAPDKYSDDEAGSDWEYHLSFARIGNLLRQAGITVGTVSGVNILEKSPTDRVLKIEVVSETGAVEMSGNRFRVNLGPAVIKSTCFQVMPKGDGIMLSGKGYGHGVGMSQKGAGQMALTGFTYRQILEFYYPGTTISDAAIVCRNS